MLGINPKPKIPIDTNDDNMNEMFKVLYFILSLELSKKQIFSIININLIIRLITYC